jgi:hypothetical protein
MAEAQESRLKPAGVAGFSGLVPPAEAGGKLVSRLKPSEAIWLSWPSSRSVNTLAQTMCRNSYSRDAGI